MYPENNGEVMPKPHLGPDRTIQTKPSTHPRAVQITWTIRNRYGRKYAEIRIPTTVSLSDGRRLTGLRDLARVTDKGLIPRVAVEWRGDVVQADPKEDARGTLGPLRRALLCKTRNTIYKFKISVEPPLYGEASKTCKEKDGTMADIHNFDTMADTATYGTMANTSTKGTNAH